MSNKDLWRDLRYVLGEMVNDRGFTEIPAEFGDPKLVTRAAVLFSCDGEDVWLPLSQLAVDSDGTVYVREWVLREKGYGE